MPTRRPTRLGAGFGAIMLIATMLMPAGEAAADAERQVPDYRSALADALGGEMAALAAFADKGLGKIDTLQDVVSRRERSSLGVIQALQSQDVDTVRRLGGMQDLMTTEQLLASLADTLDPIALDKVMVGERSEEWRCLTEAMYFEARGEGIAGQVAVAEVVLNRVDSVQYPNSVCAVVLQGAENSGACQFSYNCDGVKNRVANKRAWERIGKIAWLMLQGRPRTLTDEALYFHSTAVRPSWSRKYVRTAKIGRHVFYRPEVRLSLF